MGPSLEVSTIFGRDHNGANEPCPSPVGFSSREISRGSPDVSVLREHGGTFVSLLPRNVSLYIRPHQLQEMIPRVNGTAGDREGNSADARRKLHENSAAEAHNKHSDTSDTIDGMSKCARKMKLFRLPLEVTFCLFTSSLISVFKPRRDHLD